MPQASYKAIVHALAEICGLAQSEQALILKFCLQPLPVSITSILYRYTGNSRIRRFTVHYVLFTAYVHIISSDENPKRCKRLYGCEQAC